MAEAVTLVCDVCGRPDAQSVTFRVNGRNLVKDFCSRHISELVKGARAPRRGRKPGSSTKKAPARKATARKATARKATTPKKPIRKKSVARKRVPKT